jgi:RNA polymerase sigma factor for flagellar operon FliA
MPSATSTGVRKMGSQSEATRALLEGYHGLIAGIVGRTLRRAPKGGTFDDLFTAGWLGLLDASRRRQAAMSDDDFAAFASPRVQGAILDHLRSLDPLPRRLRRRKRALERAQHAVAASARRAPQSEDVARTMGLSLSKYHEVVTQLHAASRVSCDVYDLTDLEAPDVLPETVVMRRRLLEVIVEAIEGLPERLKLVMALYYQEEIGFRDIGAVLGVTQSRACQLHREAVQRIREAISDEHTVLGEI